MATKEFPILIIGRMHQHADTRLREAFAVTAIAMPDAALLTESARAQVRGIAVTSGFEPLAVNGAFVDAFPNLEIISSFGVGYDHIDAADVTGRGLVVTHTPDVLSEEVADTAIGLLINTVRELPKAEHWLRQGNWSAKGPYPLTRGTLRGRSVGIFGLGRIGLAIARRLEAFGLPISYHNRRRVADVSYHYHPSLLELAGAVDTLICVAPGDASTEKAVNGAVLRALGTNGVFINVGRGSAVDEDALALALKDGTIFAAGLDVFAREPHVPDGLLLAHNATLLPHVASASQHTRQAMADLVVDNLLEWVVRGSALTPVPEARDIAARKR